MPFNTDGSLDSTRTDSILVSNWEPLDSNGVPNGATGPLWMSQVATTNLPYPSTSSNFVIDLTGSTQYGYEFEVDSIIQSSEMLFKCKE